MLTINWPKIDKFYIAFVVIMILLTGLIIFSFKTVFSAFITAYDVEVENVDAELRVDEVRLNKALLSIYQKESIPLEVD